MPESVGYCHLSLEKLSCKDRQTQIISSLVGQAVAAISFGADDINASIDQETESASKT